MKKTIRKNFRLSELDCFYISALRNRSPQGWTESDVVRFSLEFCFFRICDGNLSDMEADHYDQLLDSIIAEGMESEAIDYSPSLREWSAEDVVERYPEFTDDDPELSF